MPLPVNINELLRGHSVEGERLEFKKGWNPAEELDGIQKEILNLGFKLQPAYHPLVEPCVVEGRHILVLQAPGGQSRPYKAPDSLSKHNTSYSHYLRKGSATVRASHQDEVELMGLAAQVPFDDRVNQRATVADLKLSLIQGFLPQTQIDIVEFPDGLGGDAFTEKTFAGPLDQMLNQAITYLQAAIVKEHIVKHPDRAEADRFFNYPRVALEEILANAVYHRSYEIREPIEVRVLPDQITITSYPGPDRSISLPDLADGKLVARRNRNRRIGEFLKELHLTEGRGTGIPKAVQAMRKNGSPPPRFDTNEDRDCFTATLPIHPLANTPQVSTPVEKMDRKNLHAILTFCGQPQDKMSILTRLGLKSKKNLRERYLQPLVQNGLLAMTDPEHPNSPAQKYRTTPEGLRFLQNLTEETTHGRA